MKTNQYPFIFGAQYYRAPTPEPECWEQDFTRMKQLGFNMVKYFVQWRWSHRAEGRFFWDDLDALMDMAQKYEIGVTLNTLTDMSPLWLFDKHPDAKQIANNGEIIEPYAIGHRSIGGHPGPCYNHPGALKERILFMAATYEHFKSHPALSMWDVWNEPEQSFQQRNPDMQKLTCYCPHCHRGFIEWLMKKYEDLDHLNQVWGRCYESWGQVEMPRNGGTVTDFVDWREFHLHTMAQEAHWRLKMAKEIDPKHASYLHVVPNTMTTFSSVTCVDDFQMAQHCDVFASTMNNSPANLAQLLSAARGRTCYNVESHINFGSIGMHQRRLDMNQVLADFIPQLGAGIKGFLFWQYRPEVLGIEAPAWGLVAPDGSDRPVTKAVATFREKIQSFEDKLMDAMPVPARVGVWKSRRNEIFHFGANGSLHGLAAGVEAYLNTLYWMSVPHRIVSETMLENMELEGIKLLVMPSCYYLSQAESDALDQWVQGGGVLLCEAHLGAYNGTTGRHERTVPGGGLAEAWGIREADSTSSFHLRLPDAGNYEGTVPDDVVKALRDLGTTGGPNFPIRLTNGSWAWGAMRYAVLEGENLTSEGSFDAAEICIASLEVGKGWVLYCGTNLGEGALRGGEGFTHLLKKCMVRAGINPTLQADYVLPGTVHVDYLTTDNKPQFLTIISRADEEQTIKLTGEGTWRGLFSGIEFELEGETEVVIPAGLADIFVCEG